MLDTKLTIAGFFCLYFFTRFLISNKLRMNSRQLKIEKLHFNKMGVCNYVGNKNTMSWKMYFQAHCISLSLKNTASFSVIIHKLKVG